MGLDTTFGVCAPEIIGGGVAISSSIVKISSLVELKSGRISGLVIGDGVDLFPFLVGVVSTGITIGERDFHFTGYLILGEGISCTASHSLYFSIAGLTSIPDRETDNFLPCFSAMTEHKSSMTSSCMSSNNPDSSMLSMQEMI